MAAKEFSAEEWTKIRKMLNADPTEYGLPKPTYGSIVIASFNIRKLGKLRKPGSRGTEGRDEQTMRFLADICRFFDVIAVQEVMNDTTAIRKLRDLLGDGYGLVLSDIVGTFPGERGNEERLAFLYNRNVVRRGEMVTEVSTSRSKAIKTMARYHKEFFEVMDEDPTAEAWREFSEKVEEAYLKGEKPPRRAPSFKAEVDRFVQFIRAPFAAEFVVRAQPGAEQFEFLAVNAHLHFGREIDRQNEAAALVEWILGKVRLGGSQTVVLLGDLNFDYDKPERDLARIEQRYRQLGGRDTSSGKEVFVSFPFIVGHPKHPKPDKPLRTNIRLNQTFDQIGIFSRDMRLRKYIETNVVADGASFRAEHGTPQHWGAYPTGPDYGVFNFTDLFCDALANSRYNDLDRSERAALVKRYEHKVSDHMPIWFRAPLPRAKVGFPTEA